MLLQFRKHSDAKFVQICEAFLTGINFPHLTIQFEAN